MFATGIENSIPKIKNNTVRVDEMDVCGHYKFWKTDFEICEDLGVRFLRYGPPLHTAMLGADKYDWEFADVTFAELKRRNMIPIVDLCHFGVPDFLGDFQNPDFPKIFERYARAFAARFPWVQLYTPVNEMFICAVFSAKYGWWNEQLTTDQAFVTALKNLVRANVLAMQAILEVRPDAIFIQSESSEYFHAENPAAIAPAEIMNSMRFLSLDLNYGRRVDSEMYEYLMDNGMTRDEYHFFMDRNVKSACVMGNDYYATNEHIVYPDGQTFVCEMFGYYVITKQYYERYRLPVMHTETNNRDAGINEKDARIWLEQQWSNLIRLKEDAVPIVGFTWYSLIDQIDWDSLLTEDNGKVNRYGLFDLERRIRPVGEAYRELIKSWHGRVGTGMLCMD